MIRKFGNYSLFSGILSFISLALLIIIFFSLFSFSDKAIFNWTIGILIWGYLLSIFASLILGITSLNAIWLKRAPKEQLSSSSVGIISGVINIFIIYNFLNFLSAGSHSPVYRVKREHQSLATALESYYIDNNRYPVPDYDEKGNSVIPYILTTPVAFITNLFHDPYKKGGKGLYGYGVHNWDSKDSTDGWIVTSYGPDKISGNLKAKDGTMFPIEKAWSDKSLGFALQASGLTYDPTNGTVSPGDVWRRGP